MDGFISHAPHPDAPTARDHSPWGAIEKVRALGPAAVEVTTPSHGGIWVTEKALNYIPAAYRYTRYSGRQWFEEDCDWCIPFLAMRLDRYAVTPERGAELLDYARKAFVQWHKGDPATLEGVAVGDMA